jgi:hypothetical protein
MLKHTGDQMNAMELEKKPTYNELERKITQLEKEVSEYIRLAKELSKELKRSDAEELGLVHHRLSERIKELNCLYDISGFKDDADFSMDAVLQAVVDFIPPAIQFPEITCARLIFGNYEVTTKNFKDTSWKLSREITVNDKVIGTLEVCYLEEKQELEEGSFLKEAKNLINAVAENIAKIIEREEAEAEIRKHQGHIEALIKKKA